MVVYCPAKVNLFLAVGPKDRRGYHPLRTVFQAVGLFDEIHVERKGSGPHEVLCEDPTVPSENTLTRTLRLLSEVVELPPLRLTLIKNIPSESGLGGGSSDAAGLIRLAMKLGIGTIPKAELASVATAIGADVSFFLVGGRANAEGYGEKLTPLPDTPTEWFVIARPDVGCATGPAYSRLDETPYPWRDLPEKDELYNDFERVAPCESMDLVERLQVHGARDAGLTGSGSALFGRFLDESSARLAVSRLREEGVPFVRAVPTLSRSESLRIEG